MICFRDASATWSECASDDDALTLTYVHLGYASGDARASDDLSAVTLTSFSISISHAQPTSIVAVSLQYTAQLLPLQWLPEWTHLLEWQVPELTEAVLTRQAWCGAR